MAEFLKENLINGYWNGSFKKEQVNIFAVNYKNKGQLDSEDFNEIMEGIEPPEEPEEDEEIIDEE